MSRLSRSWMTVMVYTLIMAIGMGVFHHTTGLSYGQPEMVNTLIYFEMINVLLVVFVYFKWFHHIPFRSPEKPRRWWIVVVFGLMWVWLIILIIMLSPKWPWFPHHLSLLLVLFSTMMLAGVSEELLYRGILLKACLERYSRFQSILISSLCFSVLHAMNYFGGEHDVLLQMLFTFFVGICFAALAIELNNLILLVLFHGLWDFITLMINYIEPSSGWLVLFMVMAEIVFAVCIMGSIAWCSIRRFCSHPQKGC